MRGLALSSTARLSLPERLLRPVALMQPELVEESAWLGHVPFAFWLVEAARPTCLVELGTQRGVSYAAFLQAAVRLEIPLKAFAVDSWAGDPHSGLYGEEILQRLRSHHDPRYGSFSTLLRMSFDEALDRFEAGSVDLLHIDGYHTYGAVAHDFESWLPKLSDRAVVVLHDINVREKDFGVWRFWAEQRERYPCFEFTHSHGLGVLAVGAKVDEPVAWLVGSSQESGSTHRIREFFSVLGQKTVEQQLRQSSEQRDVELARRLAWLQDRLESGEAELARRATALEEGRAYARKLEAELAQRGAAAAEARRQAEAALADGRETAALLAEARLAADRAWVAHNDKATALAEAISRVERLERETAAAQSACATASEALGAAAAEREALSSALESILASSCWRLSAPLRAGLQRFPAGRRLLRRAAALAGLIEPLPRPVAGPRGAVPEAAPAAIDERALLAQRLKGELEHFLRPGNRIAFPAVESPEISVLIVVWNQAHLTLRCLRALHGELASAAAGFEVILVDNASSDDTERLLSHVDGLRVARNQRNEGFLRACNQGASLARGRALLLLNSDAFVRPGALGAALATLDSASDIGAVGARLILPSGALQEAGSIVWSDASTLGYGRDLPPDCGEAMYRRDVDYCSGAFLMTPRSLWDRLGGFDEAFAPSYYEDADYCMRLRRCGFRVVYEPAAAADHFEFGSEAHRGDARAAMERNRKRFRARHAAMLHRSHLPHAPSNILIARTARPPERQRMLVLDNEVPLGALGSGYPRLRELLARSAAAGWSVSFFPLHRPEVDWNAVRKEIPWEIEVISGRGPTRLAQFLEERRGYYDLVLVSRPDNMRILRSILRERPHLIHGVRLIYDAAALFAAREISRASCEGRPMPDAVAEKLIAEEIALAEDADEIVCVSEAEAEAFRRRLAAPVHVLSHPAEPRQDAPGFEARHGFLFVGRLLEQTAPNWQGLSWFLREAWPWIRRQLPDAKLAVVGHLSPAHEELAAPGVRLIGPAEDLRAHYDAARVFIAPIRFGAGIPIKVLEATAAGLPTAGTRLMARQLNWAPGADMAAEDRPDAFAKAAVALHQDETVWLSTRRAATERLRREHGPEGFARGLRRLLEGAAGSDATGFRGTGTSAI